MVNSTVELTYDPVLTALCAVISNVRGDISLVKNNEKKIPLAVIKRLTQVIGPNSYRYWGSRYLRGIQENKKTDIHLICKAIMDRQYDNQDSVAMLSDSLYNECLTELANTANTKFRTYLQHMEEEMNVYIKFFPISTCPPPQFGRFGSSSTVKNDIYIQAAIGIPDLIDWDIFGINPPFIARGFLHYYLKEWLSQFEIKANMTLKSGLKEHLIKLITVILQERHENKFLFKYDLFQGENEIYNYTYQMLHKFNSKTSLYELIEQLNESWPIYIPVLREIIPKSIVEIIQMNVKLRCTDQYSLIENTRFREDLFNNHKEEKEKRIVIMPWNCAESTMIYERNKARMDKLVNKYSLEYIKENCYCILIDYLERHWQVVVFGPNRPRKLSIEPVLLTQMSRDMAMVEIKSGRILEGHGYED